MRIHVVIVAYQRAIPLRLAIDCFLVQSRPDWFMTIIHDGPAPDDVKNIILGYQDRPNIAFVETERNFGMYGFPNRQRILDEATTADGDYIIFVSDDSYYVPRFIEYFLAEAEKAEDIGMVYCDMVHSHYGHNILKAELKVNHIDMGAFMVRTDIAKQVKFKAKYEGDGIWCEDCAMKCAENRLRAIYIPKPLFCHN